MTEKCLQLAFNPTTGRCVWWPCLIFLPSAGAPPLPRDTLGSPRPLCMSTIPKVVPWEERLHFTWALLIKPICAPLSPYQPLRQVSTSHFLTHLSKCSVLILAQSYISLRQRTAPQHRDVQGEEKKSQEQQQFRRQSHHPFDAAALGSLRCGRSSDSASSRCRDSNLRIRRGRGAATPLRSHFGNQNCKKKKKKEKKDKEKKKGKGSEDGQTNDLEKSVIDEFGSSVFFVCFFFSLIVPNWSVSSFTGSSRSLVFQTNQGTSQCSDMPIDTPRGWPSAQHEHFPLLLRPSSNLQAQETCSPVGPWCPRHILSLTLHFSLLGSTLAALRTFCAVQRVTRRDYLLGSEKKVQVVKKKRKKSQPMSSRWSCVCFKNSIHPFCCGSRATPERRRASQRVLLEETSQTISNYGFPGHTLFLLCALEVVLYYTPLCRRPPPPPG